MQNPHYKTAQKIIGDNEGTNPADQGLAELAKAQIHATLAVADAVNTLIDIIVGNRQKDLAREAKQREQS